MIEVKQLAAVFVDVADTLVDDFDVVEFLQMLTTRTAMITGTTAAGLLLVDPRGQLQFMAASEESVKLLELFQLQNSEGPCLDCFATGRPVVNTELRQARSRWPRFAPNAVAEGYNSIHAFPLRHRETVIGALNLFNAHEGRLESGDIPIIQALADVATIGLLQQRAVNRGQVLTEQLQHALNSRITIEQAKGALSRIHGVSVDAAFELMRGYSRTGHHRLSDVADAVLTDPAQHPQLTHPR